MTREHIKRTLVGELAACKTIDRNLDARVAVALYRDSDHPDDRDNTHARLPNKSDECAPGTYWIVAFSGLSLRTAPGFTGDKLLRDMAVAALSTEAAPEDKEPWQVLRNLCTPIPFWYDERGWRYRSDAHAAALRHPSTEAAPELADELECALGASTWADTLTHVHNAAAALRRRAVSATPDAADVERVARAIYDAPDSQSGDTIGVVIWNSEHLFYETVEGEEITDTARRACMPVCRDAARAALSAMPRAALHGSDPE